MTTGYTTTRSWARYRDLLETRFDITLSQTPAETWREIRGHRIHIDTWEPDGPVQGTLILVHGGGGHGRVLAPFADLVVRLGWRVLAPDLPGYGLTRPARGYRGDYAEWPAVLAEIARAAEGRVVLMGLSAGGMTAVFAAEAARNVAGVIATTLLDAGDRDFLLRAARWRWLGALSLIGFQLMPWLVDRISMPVRLAVQMRSMSSDPAMNAYFSEDPLLGRLWVRLRLFRTMHERKADRLSPAGKLLLVHPGADAWTPTAISLPAFERVDGPKEFVELSNGAHLPLEQPAFDELRTCLERFLKSLPDGD